MFLFYSSLACETWCNSGGGNSNFVLPETENANTECLVEQAVTDINKRFNEDKEFEYEDN